MLKKVEVSTRYPQRGYNLFTRKQRIQKMKFLAQTDLKRKDKMRGRMINGKPKRINPRKKRSPVRVPVESAGSRGLNTSPTPSPDSNEEKA